MGNSPGLIHCGFRTAGDVSRLAWRNRKLQVWLNWHRGKDARVANAIFFLAHAQGTGCARRYISSALRRVQNSAFPSSHPFCKSSLARSRFSWRTMRLHRDSLAQALLPGCSLLKRSAPWCQGSAHSGLVSPCLGDR